MTSTTDLPDPARRRAPIDTRPPAIAAPGIEPGGRGAFFRRAAMFVAVALVLYGALYVASEHLVRETTQRNRFHRIATTGRTQFDVAILGASHALPLDFEDMNQRLESRSGRRIVNLAIEGAGVVPLRVVFEHFAARHAARHVVIFVDSFAFYARKWNEERLDDVRLFRRAPFDDALLQALWRQPEARRMAIDYASGFMKINNPDRFQSDVSEAEATRFARTYRPVAQIDRQRIEYLYPKTVDPALFQRYLAQFEDLLVAIRRTGAGVIAVKPPTPARYRGKLPAEPAFDAAIREVLARHGARFEDMSALLQEDRNYYDTDHLNRTGTAAFIDGTFGALLASLPR